MSMPSDVNPDVAEAVEAMEAEVPRKVRRESRSLFRQIPPEMVGFAAAAFVAFVGVAICGPKVREMRQPRRRRPIERARRAVHRTADAAREQAQDVRDAAGRRLRQLGGGTIRF